MMSFLQLALVLILLRGLYFFQVFGLGMALLIWGVSYILIPVALVTSLESVLGIVFSENVFDTLQVPYFWPMFFLSIWVLSGSMLNGVLFPLTQLGRQHELLYSVLSSVLVVLLSWLTMWGEFLKEGLGAPLIPYFHPLSWGVLLWVFLIILTGVGLTLHNPLKHLLRHTYHLNFRVLPKSRSSLYSGIV